MTNILKKELNLLSFPAGQAVAEKEIKHNAYNYEFHYPDREDPYKLPEKTYAER